MKSESKKETSIEEKKDSFSKELQLLCEKYSFIIYAANTLVGDWEVIPMIRITPSNDEAKKEDGESEKVITVA